LLLHKTQSITSKEKAHKYIPIRKLWNFCHSYCTHYQEKQDPLETQLQRGKIVFVESILSQALWMGNAWNENKM
jgi:hypothetical protein